MADVTMPQLGETVTEGTITKWFKQVGDEVKADEPLFEVSTDKVDTEVPSPIAGTLVEIKVNEGEVVEVGGLIAVVGDAGSASGAPPVPAAEAPAPPAAPPAPEPEVDTATEPAPGTIFSSPLKAARPPWVAAVVVAIAISAARSTLIL